MSNTISEWAERYRAFGWKPIPIVGKAAKQDGWQSFEADANTAFPGNIGVILGERSGNLVDVDLDCKESVALAQHLLPQTPTIFGRAAKPRSHWLYISDLPKTEQFKVEDGMIIEARSTGGQTMFPPSVHPSGERVEWANGFEMPAEIGGEELLDIVRDIAGLSLILRHWPELTSRYAFEGALIGVMLRAGRPQEQVVRYINALEAIGGKVRDNPPEISVPRLANALEKGDPVPGLPILRGFLGKDVTELVLRWMKLRRRGLYEFRGNGLYRQGKDPAGPPIRLTNFEAEIVEDIVHDDGSGEIRRTFVIDSPGRDRIEVPAKDFDAMGWVTETWGSEPYVFVGMKPHAAEGTKYVSQAAERTEYQHTGWRKLDGRWVYLHGGGAIGADGPIEGFSVALDGELAGYVLPPVKDIRAAVAEAALLFEMNPTIAAMVWRAVVNEFMPVAFSGYIAGSTGTFKSALAGIALGHWGTCWDGVRFPANWMSTDNSIERKAFLIKDALIVVDDFAPGASKHENTVLNAKAERIFRGAGNRSGRSRLTADAKARVTYYSRGLILGTGESVPGGHSLRARMAIEQIKPGDISVAMLTRMQRAARHGQLAEAMADFIQWVAGQVDSLIEILPQLHLEFRDKITADHKRTPDTVASLMVGVHLFFTYAAEMLDDAETRKKRALETLLLGVEAQAEEQRQEDDALIFLAAIPELLASGRAHITTRNGHMPDDAQVDPHRYGWVIPNTVVEYEEDGQPTGSKTAIHRPGGQSIGWVDDGRLYLLPDPVISEVKRMLGRDLPKRATLGKRLAEKGLLIETGKNTPTAQVKVQGRNERMFVMHFDTVVPGR